MAAKGPECSICLEHYNDENKCPWLLSCGHSVCQICLERLLRRNSIHCPTCRKTVGVPTGVAGMPRNFALLEIVNETPNEHAGNIGHPLGSYECEALWWEAPFYFLLLWLQRKHVQNCSSVSYSQQGKSWPSGFFPRGAESKPSVDFCICSLSRT